MKYLLQNGHTTWVTKVQAILRDIDQTNLPRQPKPLFTSIKKKRYRSFTDKWLEEINDSSKNPILRTYCKFKTSFGIEPYLYKASNSTFMSTIARFRTSSHCLFIEIGRHFRPPIPANLRICKFCKHGQVDDELHMLLKCNFHSNEQIVLQNNINKHLQKQIPLQYYSYEDIFVFILQQKDPTIINYLGRFLYNGFKNRQIRSDAVLLISMALNITCISLYICRCVPTEEAVD